MSDPTVTQPEPPDHFAEVAAELHRVADDVAKLAGSGLPGPRQFMLNVQPGEHANDDDATARSVDAMATALLGVRGQVQRMGGGGYHYGTDHVKRGPLLVVVYQGVSAPWALKNDVAAAESVLAEREAEVAKMRAEVAELKAANASRLHVDGCLGKYGMPCKCPLDETGPVTRYFSFGHGQFDPRTGENLLNKYVTVIAPTAEACRTAMLASVYGREWAFEYVPGLPQTEQWIPRWTEHERIDVTAESLVDETERCVASLHIPTPGESCLVCGAEGMRHGEHVEVCAGSNDGVVSAQCACGVEVDGFDSFADARAELAVHIRAMADGGLVNETGACQIEHEPGNADYHRHYLGLEESAKHS